MTELQRGSQAQNLLWNEETQSWNPIVGDDKYGCTKNPLKRLGLHASRLEFLHPITKELISIKAPVPNIFYGPFEKER